MSDNETIEFRLGNIEKGLGTIIDLLNGKKGIIKIYGIPTAKINGITSV